MGAINNPACEIYGAGEGLLFRRLSRRLDILILIPLSPKEIILYILNCAGMHVRGLSRL